MSSTYRILCLAHDPALTLEPEWHSGSDGRATAEHAAAHPTEIEGLEQHADCDLLIGRYSYPLVEVGCPAPARSDDHRYTHRDTVWVDVGWLRVLWLAQQVSEGPLVEAVQRLPRCWSPARLARLASELRMENPT